ncbi:MAG: hypothetical protein A3E57_08890 [Candidatus Muproteobacteria bacterium RIFCSPHIGHO2_12_FULL_60_33]|uniref:Uncharacterized protein n=1 Tax=Candidatus Muproteobacteria bacterium RIFCSPLOWO2_01_FULL_60_18 TaxID=1817768 RepID=A0A1F6U3Q1_9PROT|nr:MAG: hypothetical protein A3A87_08160 [Candidatus Muproteobacteria bacterium RIFCSPLOWO2_01_FULL_60_18]OGI53246.1 MAG: hypothetical protein A2W42_02035 [Candidatus Muproteobacteria bacterium RIFCSPHIGHO2_01_60_12]OGI54255.1 MAG: hypothetical protein A3D32_06350 [Candidatus Muproteobacteria bacterium RIFCSPHIGHO2_02_FULL_60_13]OGI55548.1 MAG: hypothetical protein A3E57_08890 [Candidatus Muproteobacteria bacterium RIFCSPHIGHO2_12_FULL_60_33]OGI58522.1 MAG: hypothetical protein A2809_01520 [Can
MGKLVEHRITAEEAAAFCARWQAVAGVIRAELRALPIETKLKQLDALVKLAKQLNWTSAEDDTEVRERWARLRSALHD